VSPVEAPVVTELPHELPVIPDRPRRRRRAVVTDRPLLFLAALVALAVLSPLLLVALQAQHAGWHELTTVLWRSRSAMLLKNTAVLAAIVAVLAAALGTGAAWLTERGAVPGRRLWAVALVLPIAIPDFVVGYAWHSLAPGLAPLLGATLVMTLGTYPLVYLPVAAALRRLDPALEETARTLGTSRWRTFTHVVLPMLRVPILGGAMLVVLTVISEFGAFEILGYQTFTTEVFTEFKFDPGAAAALAVPLVGLGLLVVLADAALPRAAHGSARARRRVPRQRGPWRAAGATLALLVPTGLGVGVPVGTIVYWMLQRDHATLPAAASVAGAAWSTLQYSALGAGVATLLALPVAFVGFRRRTATREVIERSTYLTRAVPGVTIALSLVFFATRYAIGLYETSTLLVAAYALLGFPLALVCVKASVAQLPPVLIDVGRSLGRRPPTVFIRIVVPLVAPGLIAAFCLVLLEMITELTATLVLAPIGVQTLATQFWAFQQNIDYAAAAPYALAMIVLAAIPGALLALWFDRDRRA
jgi:iron(III) transport system permease protein